MKWFNIITKDSLIDAIDDLDAQYLFTISDYEKILLNFGLDSPRNDEEFYPGDEDESGQDADITPAPAPAPREEIATPAGPVPVVIHVGIVRIQLPTKPGMRTPEFQNALNEARVYHEMKDYNRALNLVQYALGKDPYDQEAQDLKYDILCVLGRDEEAEEYLSTALKG
jgi:tetratricopeptide (TPR) repeat protein